MSAAFIYQKLERRFLTFYADNQMLWKLHMPAIMTGFNSTFLLNQWAENRFFYKVLFINFINQCTWGLRNIMNLELNSYSECWKYMGNMVNLCSAATGVWNVLLFVVQHEIFTSGAVCWAKEQKEESNPWTPTVWALWHTAEGGESSIHLCNFFFLVLRICLRWWT